MAEVRAAFRRWEHPDVRLAARAVSIRILKASSIDEELIWRNVLFYLGPFRLSPTLTNATGLVECEQASLFLEKDTGFSYLRSCARRKSKNKKLRHRRRGQRR